MEQESCPCGTNNKYSECCEPFHSGMKLASTAQELMRSRYCAYVKNNRDYLLASWHESTRPQALVLEPTNWLGLKIKSTRKGLSGDSEGWVEFVARYKVDGRAHRLEEHSYFVKESGVWYYLNATE